MVQADKKLMQNNEKNLGIYISDTIYSMIFK